MEYSKYQTAIFDGIDSATHNIFVEAVAGSGKTFSLVEGAKRIRAGRVLFLAFNRHIKQSLESKLFNANHKVSTIHGMGFGSLAGYCRTVGKQIKVDDDKIYNIYKSISATNNSFILRIAPGIVMKLANLAKQNGIIPDVVDNTWGMPDDIQSWERLVDESDVCDRVDIISSKFNINRKNIIEDLVKQVKEILCRDIADLDMIDYGDMLYLPLVMGLSFPKYAWIFNDEAQDYSRIDMEIIDRCRSLNTKIMACGDPRQALYQFRGAHADAVNVFSKRFGCENMRLPICYRCPTEVVTVAQRHHDFIKPWVSAIKGEVVFDGGVFDVKSIEPDSMVICRYNAPLLEVASGFIAIKKPFSFIGRDIVSSMLTLIEYLSDSNDTMVCSVFSDLLKEWFDKKIAFLVKYERLSEMATVQDRYRCLLSMIAMIHKENGRTIKDLRRFIEAVFGNENGNGVRLSSVHRAKGLECPVVYFLDYDKQVEAAEEEGIGHTSESNILYVGVTRAQRKLVMVQTSPAFRKTYYEGNKLCVKK